MLSIISNVVIILAIVLWGFIGITFLFVTIRNKFFLKSSRNDKQVASKPIEVEVQNNNNSDLFLH